MRQDFQVAFPDGGSDHAEVGRVVASQAGDELVCPRVLEDGVVVDAVPAVEVGVVVVVVVVGAGVGSSSSSCSRSRRSKSGGL